MLLSCKGLAGLVVNVTTIIPETDKAFQGGEENCKNRSGPSTVLQFQAMKAEYPHTTLMQIYVFFGAVEMFISLDRIDGAGRG